MKNKQLKAVDFFCSGGGFYFLKMTQKGQSITKKVVIQK
jgi:hypothetical protein